MRPLALVAALALPAVAHAQSYRCSVPETVPTPHADTPSAREPRRALPIGGYTLAITWAPQYCHDNSGRPGAAFQCGSGNRFGFTLHGLWPDGEGEDWPQYCSAAPLLDAAVIRRNLCATPSAQLLQHEYAKHGTCPAAYFARSTGLFAKLRYPDMNALSRRRSLTAGAFAAALARANPGMTAQMVRVSANKRGWLDEAWLCLDKQFAYAACPQGGGLAPSTKLKIWRGSR